MCCSSASLGQYFYISRLQDATDAQICFLMSFVLLFFFPCFARCSRLLEAYHDLGDTSTLEFIDRHKSLSSTHPSATPTVFPASYPFPLVAALPRKADGTSGSDKGLNLVLSETAVVLVTLLEVQPRKALFGYLEEYFEIEGRVKLIY